MALCVHYTQPAVSVFKRESLVSKLQAILSCHRDEDVDNEIFFFPFFVLKIEELKNENALLRAQLQQHGIEMVGETPPQWSGDRMNREGHHHPDIQPLGLEKKQGLVKNHFHFSECVLPLGSQGAIPSPANCGCTWLFQSYWDNHPLQLSRNVLGEKMATHHHQSAFLALPVKEKFFWTPPLFCIYVASLMDYDVCHIILSPVSSFSAKIIHFDLVDAFILFVVLSSVLICCF